MVTCRIRIFILAVQFFLSVPVLMAQTEDLAFYKRYHSVEKYNFETNEYSEVKADKIIAWDLLFDKKNKILLLQDSVTNVVMKYQITDIKQESGKIIYTTTLSNNTYLIEVFNMDGFDITEIRADESRFRMRFKNKQ
jgi:hypothetical protein